MGMGEHEPLQHSAAEKGFGAAAAVLLQVSHLGEVK